MKDLHKQNVSLMIKWWWKLETQTGMWQDIVRARYLTNKSVASVKPRFSDSPCWKALLKVKDIYLVGRKIHLESGDLVRVWKDSINGLSPFQTLYPSLFEICNNQDCTIANFKSVDVHSFFRRRLIAELSRQWEEINKTINNIQLSQGGDRVYWGLNSNGKFSTKSVYKWLENPISGYHYSWIWRAKIPLKINVATVPGRSAH